mgnify:CR=1 FL=1
MSRIGAQVPSSFQAVVLPIVENSVSAASFRPGDVYPSRGGLTVEIGNTDAEGRLVLADALSLADEEEPDMLFDFATLTGAARVALGPDLPAFFTGDDRLAADILDAGTAAADPVWRLPLWSPYDSLLDSKVADVNNVSSGPFAGAIVAALFLRRFVKKAGAWAHAETTIASTITDIRTKRLGSLKRMEFSSSGGVDSTFLTISQQC